MRRYALRDDQWERIKGLLPGREGHVGVTAKDNRLFVEAVLYRYRAGIPWRDLPERFGDPIKIHTRCSTAPSYAHISTAPALKKRWRRPGDRAQQRRIEHQNPRHGRRPWKSAGLLPDCGAS